MVRRSIVHYCEAEAGEYIGHFAEELVAYRKKIPLDIIAVFNDTHIYVTSQMTTKDVIKKYDELRR